MVTVPPTVSLLTYEVAYEVVQILGGKGCMKNESSVELYYRDVRITETY
jgi:alkylation response protein AidB-like acyl-CoA dehydrogenase